MGQIAYGQVPQYPQGQSNGVGFFSLRDDGDEAIVRIMHDSPATFEIVAVHPYQVNGKFRNINCIRDPQEDIDKCPLCEAGVRLSYRFFIHLIEYTKDDRGNIVATPKVWERGVQYADTIRDFCNEYPPLSNYLFKIKRNGKKGSTDTTYNIIPANPNVYRPDLYPKDDTLFEGYSVIGNAVYNTDYNGLQRLLVPTEQEPYTPKAAQASQSTPQYNPPAAYAASTPADYSRTAAPSPVYQTPAQSQPTYTPSAPASLAPQETAAQVYIAPSQQYAPPVGYNNLVGHPDPIGAEGAPGVVREAPPAQENYSGEFVRPRRYA